MTEPWLLVQEGSKIFLLAKDQLNFILISVNKKLTDEAEEQLCRRAITPQLLQEMGLNFQAIPKNRVRGVALTGSDASDTLYFYLTTGKKQKYVFSDDYEQERTDAFFAGVQRFTPPKNGGKKKKKAQDWRVDRQDPKVFDQLWFLAPLLTVLSFIFAFAYRMRGGWALYLLSLVWVVIPVLLDIVFPAYFTLIMAGKGEKKKARNLFGPLLVHAWLMTINPGTNWMDDKVFLILWAVCGVLFAALMGLLAEEFRREKAYLAVVFLLAGLFGAVGAGRFNEALDFSEPEVYILTVEDLQYSGGKHSSYRCFTTLPDGREADMYIKADFYKTLEVGDPIRVEVSTGALGIEYVNAYPIE